jgi:TFIIF-interacting CTD phosphatase-like protein
LEKPKPVLIVEDAEAADSSEDNTAGAAAEDAEIKRTSPDKERMLRSRDRSRDRRDKSRDRRDKSRDRRDKSRDRKEREKRDRDRRDTPRGTRRSRQEINRRDMIHGINSKREPIIFV